MSNDVFRANRSLKAFAYAILGFSTILVIYPIIFVLLTSFKSNKDFYVNIFGIPKTFEWINYVNAWNIGNLGKYFGNSVLVSAVSVFSTCLIATLGGYALAKLHIPKANLIISVFMVFNFIPGIAIYISLYSMMGKMHLMGNYFTLILPYIAWQIPFSMYIMKQYFETVPQELIESGRIDGCTELKTFSSIMFPLVTPALATIIVFTFIGNWGELMWASITTASNITIMTLPVGLLNFKTEMGVEWGQYTAGVCMVTIPLMVVFAYCQKYFVAGLTNGAVKG